MGDDMNILFYMSKNVRAEPSSDGTSQESEEGAETPKIQDKNNQNQPSDAYQERETKEVQKTVGALEQWREEFQGKHLQQ